MEKIILKFLIYLALGCGFIFLFYAVRYYLITIAVLLKHGGRRRPKTKRRISPIKGISCCSLLYSKNIFFDSSFNKKNSKKGKHGLLQKVDHLTLPTCPFISVHIPFYNEKKKVIDRVLNACLNFDYTNYEIIICDDSTDKSIDYIYKKWGRHPKIKILHRDNRTNYKGGALQNALKHINPKTEFVVVFDADFVPYPDTLQLFLKYFLVGNGGYFNFEESKMGAVQGYQWHVLNKNENWITKGIYVEFGGSYVFDRYGTELFKGFKQIAGSVFMVRADLLRKFGWGASITEDWELTLNLYKNGYKVVYTPHIQAPAECVNTFTRLRKQRMRWAEGHTRDVRKHFWGILFSSDLNWREKLEFLYLAGFYLQSFFFLVGTISWLIVELLFPQSVIPWWTPLLGWSLVFTNFFALPLLNLAALFLQRANKRDALGILSFVILGWLLIPFQTWAALRGLFIDNPSYWFRTPKTGRLTRLFRRKKSLEYYVPSGEYIRSLLSFRKNKFKFSNFWFILILYLLAAFTLVFVFYSSSINLAKANPDLFYFHRTATGGVKPNGKDMNSSPPTIPNPVDVGDGTYYFYSTEYPTGNDDAIIAEGNYDVAVWVDADSSFTFDLSGGVYLCDPDGSNCSEITSDSCSITVNTGLNEYSCDLGLGLEQTIISSSPKILRITLIFTGLTDGQFSYDSPSASSGLNSPTVTVPESVIWFTPLILGLLILAGPKFHKKLIYG